SRNSSCASSGPRAKFRRCEAQSGAGLNSGLRLPLTLPAARLFDLDRHGEGFHAAAISGTAHRRPAEVVEPDGDAGMRVGGGDAVSGIETDPAEIGHERLRPGVAGLLMHHAV